MGHYNRGDRLLSVARRHRVVVVVVVGGGDFGRVRFARYQYLLPGPVVFVVWWPMINSCWLRLLLPGLRKRPTNNVRAAANHDRQHEIKRARGIRDTMTLGDSRQTHMTERERKSRHTFQGITLHSGGFEIGYNWDGVNELLG